MEILVALATILNIIGNCYVNEKDRKGFLVWIAASTLLIVSCSSLQQFTMFLANLLFEIHGYLKWKRSDIDEDKNSCTNTNHL